jgi:hypothetical protein
MKKRNYLVIAILTIVIFLFYQYAFASSSVWYGTVGGVNVRAEKWVRLQPYLWDTQLYSLAAQWINIIGYTYWTVGEYCPNTGTWASWHQYPGDYRTYDDYYYSSATLGYAGCSGISQYKSLGNHDFAYGTEHKYPYVSTYERR